MPINSALLKSEAFEVAKTLGLNDFAASNGWMDSFASRHQLKFANLHGESAGVDPQVCTQWREQLHRICNGYKMEDIWNVDETGIFFRSVPTKSWIKNGETPHGTKAQTMKEHFTALLACSVTGEKEKLWIIGQNKHPHSMPKPAPRLFVYRSNQKAWVTTEIFVEFLNALNNKMKCKGRHILLFFR